MERSFIVSGLRTLFSEIEKVTHAVRVASTRCVDVHVTEWLIEDLD